MVCLDWQVRKEKREELIQLIQGLDDQERKEVLERGGGRVWMDRKVPLEGVVRLDDQVFLEQKYVVNCVPFGIWRVFKLGSVVFHMNNWK